MKFYVVTLSTYSVLATMLIGILTVQNLDLKKSKPSNQQAIDFDKHSVVPIGNAPIKGNVDAIITIVEFSDYECTMCSQSVASIGRLMNEYPGKIKVALKNYTLPSQPAARLAAQAALAAGEQGKYWEMHDILMQTQNQLDRESFLSAAASLGLGMARFKKDLEDPKWEDIINNDSALAMGLGVHGTPTFFVNGIMIPGNDYDNLKRAFDHVLAESGS